MAVSPGTVLLRTLLEFLVSPDPGVHDGRRRNVGNLTPACSRPGRKLRWGRQSGVTGAGISPIALPLGTFWEGLMRLGPINLFDYEVRAKHALPHDTWDFIAGGSKDEITTERNRTAFNAISLRPRMLRDVTERKLATTVLGEPISFPVMVCPAGGHKIAHLDGECATARGAGMSKTLMMLS